MSKKIKPSFPRSRVGMQTDTSLLQGMDSHAGAWEPENVISKAKTACDLSEHSIPDHFADVGKMVELGSGSQREINTLVPTLLRGNAYGA